LRTYTVIGDVVNTAKRLESATPAGEITLSDAVYQALHQRVAVQPAQSLRLKGKDEPLQVWRLA
jgi:adenylate cyclase